MRNLIKKIKIDVYDCNISFVLTTEGYNTVHSLFKKHDQMDRWETEGVKNNNFSGFAFDATLNDYYIIFNKLYPIDHHTITHEIWHLVHYMFEHRGIIENRDHEAGAWVSGYLAKEIYKFLNTKKIKIV